MSQFELREVLSRRRREGKVASCLARRRRAGRIARGKRVKRAQPLETGPKDNGALEGRQDASPQLLFVEFDVA